MFNYNGYRVRFVHSRLADPDNAIFTSYPLAQGITICRIEKIVENGGSVSVGQGIAACSRRDVFHKRIGRKIALTRALADARVLSENKLVTRKFTKDERRGFWTAYFERMGVNYAKV